MKKFTIAAVSAVIASTLLAGCGSTSKPYQPTPEQQAQALKAQQAFKERLMAGMLGMKQAAQAAPEPAPAPAAPAVALAELTNEQLLAAIAEIDADGGPATFSLNQQGELYINGQAYIDLDGSISLVGSDDLSGSFVYSVVLDDNTLLLKYHRAGSSAAPLHFATMTISNSGYRLTTVTGLNASGSTFMPTSKGVILKRSNALISYEFGQNFKTVSLPKDFSPTPFQRGDVGSTRLVLLERNEDASGAGQVGLMSAFQVLGVGRDDDYLLFNIDDGTKAVLNMNSDRKNQTAYSQCQRQNDFVRKCAKSHSYESLYTQLGTKNHLHYFWAVDWFNTPAGPMGVYNSGSKVSLVDLQGRKEFVLFERMLGVNEFTVKRDLEQNKVGLSVKLGLSTEEIDDVVEHLSTQVLESTPMRTML